MSNIKLYLIKFAVLECGKIGIAEVSAANAKKAQEILQANGKYNGYKYAMEYPELVHTTDTFTAESLISELDNPAGEKGDRGPAGPQGPQGPQGPKGEKGEDASVTEEAVSNLGFTKGVKINGSTKTPNDGIVDLGTVITRHQDISGKQDIISDLETIRINASKGAAALQEVPDEYITETELVNKEYATQTWVENKKYLTSHQDISGKQDVLVSGENIKTINGESLLGQGDIETSKIKYKSMISDGNQGTREDYYAEINTINYIDLRPSQVARGVGIHVPYLIEPIEGDTPNTYSKECQILLRPGNPQMSFVTNVSNTIGGIEPYIIWTNGEPDFSSDYLYEISFKGFKDKDGIKYLAVYTKYEIT